MISAAASYGNPQRLNKTRVWEPCGKLVDNLFSMLPKVLCLFLASERGKENLFPKEIQLDHFLQHVLSTPTVDNFFMQSTHLPQARAVLFPCLCIQNLHAILHNTHFSVLHSHKTFLGHIRRDRRTPANETAASDLHTGVDTHLDSQSRPIANNGTELRRARGHQQ